MVTYIGKQKDELMNEITQNHVNEAMHPCEILEIDDDIAPNEWASLLESLQISVERMYC